MKRALHHLRMIFVETLLGYAMRAAPPGDDGDRVLRHVAAYFAEGLAAESLYIQRVFGVRLKNIEIGTPGPDAP